MAIDLYPHNQETYENMIEMFKTSNRVGIVQPTGTGKSFIYLKWIEDHSEDFVVLLSPSNEIFNQFYEYAEASDSPELLKSVQMISYQTLLKMTDEEVRTINPDKIVLDEFHRTGADLWGPSLQRLLNANPHAQVLGATATPVRYLDSHKNMAEQLFGKNLAAQITLGAAVAKGILPTPKYIPVWYDVDGKLLQYKRDISKIKNIEERKNLEERLELMKRRLESSYGAEKIFKKNLPHNHCKFVVFCRNKEHLEEMMAKVPQWMAGVNKNVRSYVSISAQEDNDFQLQSFKDDNGKDAIKLLFTIDRLNEGVHIKGINGVIMLRPTTSPIIYLQQMGRALAAGEDAPLIFDMVNNYLNVQVVTEDGEHHNVFGAELGGGVTEDRDIEEFHILEDVVSFNAVIADFESNLYFTNDDLWHQQFYSLCAFIKEFGRFPFESDPPYNGFKLGNWCRDQKTFAKKGLLSPERFSKLEAIGLFDHNIYSKWEKTFSLFVDFINEFGRFPNEKDAPYKNVDLYSWYKYQLSNKNNLSDEQLKNLNSIGFFDLTHDVAWERNYNKLKKFIRKFNRMPKKREVFEDVNLGTWANKQRQAFKNGTLSEERTQKLLDIGFIFDPLEHNWQQNFEAYKRFKSVFHREPKKGEVFGDLNIGNWVHNQREAYKKGLLSNEKINKLYEAGFIFQFSSLDDLINGASSRAAGSSSSGALPVKVSTFER